MRGLVMANNAFTQMKAELEAQQNGETPATRSPAVVVGRGAPSAETSYDVGAPDVDAVTTHPFKPGVRRAFWVTPPNTMRSQVTSIKDSAFPQKGSQNGAYRAGLKLAPTTSLATYSVIPDMSVGLQTNGQVSAQLIGSFEGPTNATLSFALFRDGVQVSRDFPVVPAAAASPFLVNVQVIDSPQPGVHSYDARWQTSAGTATAAAYSRSIQVQNLRPQ
jgi:hypothetical protein